MQAPALRDLQRLFLEGLLACPEGEGASAGAAPALVAVLAPAERFSIYTDMYFWRLQGVLAEDFPRLAEALGCEPFTDLAREYLRRHPSENPSVRHAGRHMAEHLGTGWEGGLARLEWARVDAFDAPDATPVDRSALGAVPADAWPGLRFTVVPSLTVVESGWPVHRIWDDPACRPDPEATAIRVWRREHAVWHAPMSPAEAVALAALRGRQPFETICATVDDPAEVAGLLARWIDDGLIAGVHRAA